MPYVMYPAAPAIPRDIPLSVPITVESPPGAIAPIEKEHRRLKEGASPPAPYKIPP